MNKSIVHSEDRNTIFIIGGTGSLGNFLVDRFLSQYTIYIYSRDENKQWHMKNKYNSKNIHFIIGDISDKERLENTLLRYDPNYIIIAAALKHIDVCEYNTSESIKTNITGIQNIMKCITPNNLPRLKTVLFVSTDKACNPSNVYGMCKAISERVVIEKSLENKTKKFVIVRYGNVLNSRGSLLPKFHNIGKNKNNKSFTVTHKNMTRFFMSLNESVDLIEYALFNGVSGHTYVPTIISFYIKDIAEIYSKLYDKPIVYTGIRPGEKIHETLINEMELRRTNKVNNIYIIRPPYETDVSTNISISVYDSQSTLSHNTEIIKKIIKEYNL